MPSQPQSREGHRCPFLPCPHVPFPAESVWPQKRGMRGGPAPKGTRFWNCPVPKSVCERHSLCYQRVMAGREQNLKEDFLGDTFFQKYFEGDSLCLSIPSNCLPPKFPFRSRESANFFCKGPESKYVRLCRQDGLCRNHSTLQV